MTLPGIQFWHKQKLHASTPLWGLNYPAKRILEQFLWPTFILNIKSWCLQSRGERRDICVLYCTLLCPLQLCNCVSVSRLTKLVVISPRKSGETKYWSDLLLNGWAQVRVLGHGDGVGRWTMKYQTKSLTFLISFDRKHNIYTTIIITVRHNTVVHHHY